MTKFFELWVQYPGANMGKRKPSTPRHSSKRARRPFSVKVRRAAGRRKGSARPTRSLRTSYRGTPNQYRFVRETTPVTIDLGTTSAIAGAPTVTVIAGTGAIPSTSMVHFGAFTIADLTNFVAEFHPLFANYKVDSITTYMIPQWTQSAQLYSSPATAVNLSDLLITRVNTKFLAAGYTAPATAEASRLKLSQIMMKKRSQYASRKWLKVHTTSPDVPKEIPDGAAGVNATQQRAPWLPIASATNQQFIMNDTFFADTLNGVDVPVGIFKYRVYHKVNFRCAYVQ